MNLIFVDFENVHNTGLNGLENLTENEIVYLFYSKNTPHLPMDVVAKISKSPADIELIESGVGKNAMDFVIASYLGYMINEHDDNVEYYILSKDKGYKPLVDFWEDWNVKMIGDLTQFAKKNKVATKKTKPTVSKTEQALRSNIGRVLNGYNKEIKNQVVNVILKSKSKAEVNNKLVKVVGNTQKAGQVYQKIKEYL